MFGKQNWKGASTFSQNLIGTLGDTLLSILSLRRWIHTHRAKTRQSVRKTQVCSINDSCIWLCAEEYKKRTCLFYYAYENKNFLERSKLSVTTDDLVRNQDEVEEY